MVTSFPIPGEYDGTAMLPIKILRALKAARGRGGAGAPAGAAAVGRPIADDFEGTPSFTCRRPPGSTRTAADRPRVPLRPGPRPALRRRHAGLPPAAYGWPLVYEIHSLLGDEVERDRLGRGLVFRSTRAVERRSAGTRPRSSSSASRSSRSSSRRRASRPTGSRSSTRESTSASTTSPATGRRSRASAPSTR